MLACVTVTAGLTALASCGEDEAQVPASAVATVGDTIITKRELARRFTPMAAQIELTGQRARAAREQLLGNLTRTLIESEWIEREAAAQHVTASRRDVASWYEGQRGASTRAARIGGDNSVYEMRLRVAKGVENARRSEGRIDLLRRRLIAKVTPPRTEASARAFYRDHLRDYQQPERRVLRYVLTATRNAGKEARAARIASQPWPTVAKRYSAQDGASPLATVGPKNLPRPLARFVFRQPPGQLTGPVKAGRNWILFQIDHTLPASRTPFSRVRGDIYSSLVSTGFTAGFNKLSRQLVSRYKAITTCASGVSVDYCRHGQSD